MRLLLPLLVVALVACGARDGLGTTRDEPLDAAPALPQDAAVDAAGPEVAPPEPRSSCLPECQAPSFRAAHPALCDCPEFHDAGPAGCWVCAALWAPDCANPPPDAEQCDRCGLRCDSTPDAGGD